MLRVLVIGLGVLVLCTVASIAQPNPGDLVIASADFQTPLRSIFKTVRPGGRVTTLFTVPGWVIYSLRMDNNNRDFLVAGFDPSASPAALLGRITPTAGRRPRSRAFPGNGQKTSSWMKMARI